MQTIEQLVQLIVDGVAKIQGKKADAILAKPVHIGNANVRIVLPKAQGFQLSDMLNRNLDRLRAKSDRHDIVFHRTDHLHRDLFTKRGYERVARWKFREPGYSVHLD